MVDLAQHFPVSFSSFLFLLFFPSIHCKNYSKTDHSSHSPNSPICILYIIMTLLHRILFMGEGDGVNVLLCAIYEKGKWKSCTRWSSCSINTQPYCCHYADEWLSSCWWMVGLMKYTCNKIDCCHHLMKSCHRETDCSPLSLTLIPLRKIKCFSLFLLSCSSLHYFVSFKKKTHILKKMK